MSENKKPEKPDYLKRYDSRFTDGNQKIGVAVDQNGGPRIVEVKQEQDTDF